MSSAVDEGVVVRNFPHWMLRTFRWLSGDKVNGLRSERKPIRSTMQFPLTRLMDVSCDVPNASSGGSRMREMGRLSLIGMLGFSLPIPLLDSMPRSFTEPGRLVQYGLIFGLALAVVYLFREAMRARMLKNQVSSCEQRWLALLECAPFPILKCDSQGRIEYANQALLRATGSQNQDILGRHESSLTVPTEPSGCGEEPVLLPQTNPLHRISWFSVELRSPDGGTHGTLWIGCDAVELVAAQSERDSALKELAELRQQVEEQNRLLEVERDGAVHSTRILGQSDAIRYVLHKIGQVASTNATVLIEGETGVGKELVARTIHENSPRCARPLIIVNCAALPPSLIESELFGHEKGSFTGADRMRQGRFELADGGTLFLDEIGELGLDLQSKLLRVLQDGEYTRIGGTRTIRANVRVIAATNIDLAKAVENGRFRKDLYYRLQVFPITVPALRERREDIPILTQHFVDELCRRHGRPVLDIRMSVINRLAAHDWPGNVRELENVIERAVITSLGTVLTLPPEIAESGTKAAGNSTAVSLSLAAMERRYIKEVLARVNGQIAGSGGAAEILGLHPNTLRGRMAKLGISRMEAVAPEASQFQAGHENGEHGWILKSESKGPASAGVTLRT